MTIEGTDSRSRSLRPASRLAVLLAVVGLGAGLVEARRAVSHRKHDPAVPTPAQAAEQREALRCARVHKPIPARPLDPAEFPLQLAPNRKFLVDQSGRPFLLQGDSPWELIQNLSRAEVTDYLDARRRQGFNSLILELIEHFFTPTGHSPAWVDSEGNAPFVATLPGARCPNPTGACLDFSKPNEKYFRHVDWVISQARQRGFLVLLTVAYLGAKTGRDNNTHLQGWLSEMKANGVPRLLEYGRFLGLRYRDFPNVVWVHGGDYTPTRSGNPSEMDLVNAIAQGILESERGFPAHFQTAHFAGDRGNQASDIGPSWLTIDSTYTALGSQSYTEAQLQVATDSGKRPVFLIESPYENSTAAGGRTTPPDQLRAQMYEPILSGEMGFNYGSVPVWYLGRAGDGNPAYGYGWAASTAGLWATWSSALNSPGSHWARLAGQFFRSIAWETLVPDTTGTVLTSGNGVGGTILAYSPERRLAVAYFSAGATATLDGSALKHPASAAWYDPTSGEYSTAPELLGAKQSYTSPHKNCAGSDDWILVLRAE